MAWIAILCLFGCAVIPNDPSQLSPLVPGDTKTDIFPDIAGCNSDKGIVISPGGKSSGDVSLAQILYENDSERAANLANADNGQVPIKQSLLSVSIRATFSSIDVLGDVAPEEFREYGVAANFRLPWAWYSQSGWGAGTRLMASAGALYGAGDTALVVSLIPLVAFGSQDGRFTLDMGAGGALLSRHHFGTQDFGGCFQFALTVGRWCSALRTARSGLPVSALFRCRNQRNSHHGGGFAHAGAHLPVLKAGFPPRRTLR